MGFGLYKHKEQAIFRPVFTETTIHSAISLVE